MFEQWVELDAVEAAPRAVEVVPGLSLLPRVVVVQELIQNPGLLGCFTTGFSIGSCPVDFLGVTTSPIGRRRLRAATTVPGRTQGAEVLRVLSRHQRPGALYQRAGRLVAPRQPELEGRSRDEGVEAARRIGL